MIDYTEQKKKRINFSISPKAVDLLKTNIQEQRRSMFVDFLITRYCEFEAGNFNRLFFSKETAEILARNNKNSAVKEEKSELPELISELKAKLFDYSCENKRSRREFESINTSIAELSAIAESNKAMVKELEDLTKRVEALRNG